METDATERVLPKPLEKIIGGPRSVVAVEVFTLTNLKPFSFGKVTNLDDLLCSP